MVEISAYAVVFFVCLAVFFWAILTDPNGYWMQWRQRRNSAAWRLKVARIQIRRVLEDTEQQMNRVAGRDPFNFGGRGDW